MSSPPPNLCLTLTCSLIKVCWASLCMISMLVVASGESSQAAYSRKSCRLMRLNPLESKHLSTPARAAGLVEDWGTAGKHVGRQGAGEGERFRGYSCN